MMKLETMRRVVASLGEKTTLPVNSLVSRWGNDIHDVRFFRSSANFVFTFTMAGTAYFLRFNHEDERMPETIKQELAFVHYLLTKGMSVAKPVPSRTNRLIESMESPLGTFHGVVFEALTGTQYETTDLSAEQWALWGNTLAELHQRSSTCERLERPGWHEGFRWLREVLPEEETLATRLAEKLEGMLASLVVSQSNFGLIHGDFELDNLIWQGDTVQVLDFDECRYAWFVADVAFALRDLFADDPARVDLKNPQLASFVTEYRSVKPLPDDELRLLPLFLCFHNLWTFSRLQRTLSDLGGDHRPEWLQQLVTKLLATQAGYRERFAVALERF